MIDTGTGKGQVAGSQGAGIDLNWKPIAYGVNEEEILKKTEKGKDGKGFLHNCPIYQMFVCLLICPSTQQRTEWLDTIW